MDESLIEKQNGNFANTVLGAVPSVVYNEDCVEGLKRFSDNHFELAIVDPPYGIGAKIFNGGSSSNFIKKQSKKISKTFEKIDSNKVTKGIVHMDIWYDNMNIKGQNEPTIFDFDFCGNGLLIFDVAYFCKQLFHIEVNKDEYELKIQSFLKGYQSIRTLSEEEIKMIPDVAAAIWIFYLGVQSQRFDWSNIFLIKPSSIASSDVNPPNVMITSYRADL